jgi:hypothetical protein
MTARAIATAGPVADSECPPDGRVDSVFDDPKVRRRAPAAVCTNNNGTVLFCFSGPVLGKSTGILYVSVALNSYYPLFYFSRLAVRCRA